MVYRGFACAEEALNVLICQTVGGVKECPKLTGMALQNAINDQKQCFEGESDSNAAEGGRERRYFMP